MNGNPYTNAPMPPQGAGTSYYSDPTQGQVSTPPSELETAAAIAQMSKSPTKRDMEMINWGMKDLINAAAELSQNESVDKQQATDYLLSEIWLRLKYLQEISIIATHPAQRIMLEGFANRLAAMVETIYELFPFKDGPEIARSIREDDGLGALATDGYSSKDLFLETPSPRSTEEHELPQAPAPTIVSVKDDLGLFAKPVSTSDSVGKANADLLIEKKPDQVSQLPDFPENDATPAQTSMPPTGATTPQDSLPDLDTPENDGWGKMTPEMMEDMRKMQSGN